MSQRINLNAPLTHLTRRSWIVLAASALSGCGGGGGGGSTAGLPGTGGTGIYAQGSISGFGSVILNGIKFDDTAAMVYLDGQKQVNSTNLRLGMVAGVQGQRGADLTLGVARVIDVWSIAQGTVSQLQQGQFKVAGMLVQTDLGTVLDGISTMTPLSNGMAVTVWGLQAGVDGSTWKATRVALVASTTNIAVSTGLVKPISGQLSLNELLLTGAAADSLTVGQLVRVQGFLSGSNLQVDSAQQQGLQSGTVPQQGELEIEGLVTAKLSTTSFMLGNVQVDASSATFTSTAAPIATGQRVEVYGKWLGQVLKAVKVGYEGAQTLDEAEIEALIDEFTSIANFVMRGQRCDATNAMDATGVTVRAEAVRAAYDARVKVKVKGTKAGDVLKVTSLAIDN